METLTVSQGNHPNKKRNKENLRPPTGAKSFIKTGGSSVPLQPRANKDQDALNREGSVQRLHGNPKGGTAFKTQMIGPAVTDTPRPASKSTLGMYKGRIVQSKIGSIWKSSDSLTTAVSKVSDPGKNKRSRSAADVSGPATDRPAPVRSQSATGRRHQDAGPCFVRPPTRTNRAATGTSAANRAAAGPSATNRAAAGPSAANRAAAGPSASNRAAAGPSASNRAATGTSAANRAAAGPSATNRAAAGTSAANRAAAGPSATNRAAAGPSAANRAAARTSAANRNAAGPSAANRTATGRGHVKPGANRATKPNVPLTDQKAKKPVVSSTLSQYRVAMETAEEKRAKLAEWLAAKGRTLKRPAMAAVAPPTTKSSAGVTLDPKAPAEAGLHSAAQPEAGPDPERQSQTPGIMSATLELLDDSEPLGSVDDIVVNLCDVLDAVLTLPSSADDNAETPCERPEQDGGETKEESEMKDQEEEEVMEGTPPSDASVIRYSVRTTPYLQSVRRTIEERAGVSGRRSHIKDLKFLTPVRRSSRLHQKSAVLPAMLTDPDPCVSSLAELVQLDDEPNAYIYRVNPALLQGLPDQDRLNLPHQA